MFFIYFLFLSDEGPMLETLDHTIRIGSTPTFLYFDFHYAYAAHYVYFNVNHHRMQFKAYRVAIYLKRSLHGKYKFVFFLIANKLYGLPSF